MRCVSLAVHYGRGSGATALRRTFCGRLHGVLQSTCRFQRVRGIPLQQTDEEVEEAEEVEEEEEEEVEEEEGVEEEEEVEEVEEVRKVKKLKKSLI